MKSLKPKKPSRADLERKIKELTAQLPSTYHFANGTIDATERLMGSAVILELTGLGGKQMIVPVAIRDGLSPETIAALRADIARSYERSIELKA